MKGQKTIRQTICFLLTAVMVLCSLPGQMLSAYGKEMVNGNESTRTFVHPGMLHTEEAFESMRENIENQVSPNAEAFVVLCGNGFSNAGWNPRPLETVSRGGAGDNRAQFYIDIRRAYQNALIYNINGDEAHGDAAIRILNSWSQTMKSLIGNADRFLAAGIYGYELANAAELMRDHPDFDKESMDTLLRNVFYPMNHDFLINHNSANISNYWANWDLCNIASMVAIGIYLDDEAIYNEAIAYMKAGRGNGSIYNCIPFVFENGTAQWQETCRDQGHTTFGLSLYSVICEMAWNQGDDLYGWSDNRLLKAAEYTARYNGGIDELDFATMFRWRGQGGGTMEIYQGISGAARYSNRPIYHMIYNHYVNRRGLSAPFLEKMLIQDNKLEYECTNGDELGWQSLTFANLSHKTDRLEVAGDIPDGTYRILSVLTGKSIVVNDANELASAEKGTKTSENWQIIHIGGNEYKIVNTQTGKCMQVNDYYERNGQIVTGDYTGALNQKFAIIPNIESEDYRIVPSVASYVLELSNADTSDTARYGTWTYSQHPCQRWTLELVESSEADSTNFDPIRPTALEYQAYDALYKQAIAVKASEYTKATYENLQFTLGIAGKYAIDSNIRDEVLSATIRLKEALAELETAPIKEKGIIAHFNLDNEQAGLSGRGAVATVNGAVEFTEDDERGKVMRLDGSTAFLNVTKTDGTPLLTGTDEITVSYYSKPEGTAANWAIYAAPNMNAQTYLSEYYLGAMEKEGSLTVERYLKGRTPVAQSDYDSDAWKHVVITFGTDDTKVYIDGNSAGISESNASIREILGEYSILQIGKANWGNGEYFTGLMDEIKIYDYALTASQVTELEKGGLVTDGDDYVTVNYLSDEHGSISGNSTQEVIVGGSSSTVTAIAEEGYAFLQWSDGLTLAKRQDTDLTENKSVTATFVRKNDTALRRKIAEFSFDNRTNGIVGCDAKASIHGGISFIEDSERGKVAYLNANGTYFSLAKANGDPLLRDEKELTISFYSKPIKNVNNWIFYIAPNEALPVLNAENYIGAFETTSAITLERYYGGRSDVPTSEITSDWKHVVVVLKEDKTELYIDGTLKSSKDSVVAISDVVSANGIAQIGKANWGGGEYYKGYIDDFSVYNYALTSDEVTELQNSEIGSPESTVYYVSAEGGTIKGESVQNVKKGENTTTVEAVADEGYHFVKWNDGSTDRFRKDQAVSVTQTYVAYFEADDSSDTPTDPSEPTDPNEPTDPSEPNEPTKPSVSGNTPTTPMENDDGTSDVNKPKKVTGIKISGISKKIAVGKKITLTAEIVPADADNQEVTWTTSNKKFASVSAKGVVKVKKAGIGKSVTIKAYAKDGSGVTASYKIKIMKNAVTKVKVTATSKKVKAGKKLKLKATVKTNGKKANKTLQWTSSNTTYATVNKKGVVTTKKAGKGKTVTITARSTDGSNKKAKIKIKIQ